MKKSGVDIERFNAVWVNIKIIHLSERFKTKNSVCVGSTYKKCLEKQIWQKVDHHLPTLWGQSGDQE